MRYKNEFFGGGIQEEKVSNTFPNEGNIKYSFNSIIVSGSFCPNITGVYGIKIEAKPYADFTIQGQTLGNIGVGGSCGTPRTEESAMFTLSAHMCYPITARFRSGCQLATGYFRVLVGINGGSYQSGYGNDLLITTAHSDCENGYWGAQCENRCTVDCHNNGYCSNGTIGTGKCVCYSGLSEYGCLSAPAQSPEFTKDGRSQHRFVIRRIRMQLYLFSMRAVA